MIKTDDKITILRISVKLHYGGGYRLEYDGKYVTLLGKDKRYKCMYGDDYEEMVLIPVVMEVRDASPIIIGYGEDSIIVSLYGG